jgi:hypothetical protein
MVEQYLAPEHGVAPPDYKFHCVDGRVAFGHYIVGRYGDTHEAITDRDGTLLPQTLYFPGGAPFARPPEWGQMLEVAEAVAAGFRYVRVDQFLHRGRAYVGEMTFWPNGGCYTTPGQAELGARLRFERTTVRPPIYRRIRRRVVG